MAILSAIKQGIGKLRDMNDVNAGLYVPGTSRKRTIRFVANALREYPDGSNELLGVRHGVPPSVVADVRAEAEALIQRERDRAAKQQTRPSSSKTENETSNQQDMPQLQSVEGDTLNLVNYSSQELMQHVENTLSTVHFGMSASAQFMETVAQLWAVIGPVILLAGTAGEVFYFIWQYTNDPAWWVGMSVLATVVVLEATFMVVSWKSATIRSRAESRQGGKTDLDKAKLKRYRNMWFILGLGVGSGQVAFLFSAMSSKLGNVFILVLFAVVRTAMTLASDYYTAFVHEEKPTDGEQAKTKQEQRAQLASQLLNQKQQEVTIINEGILGLQRAHTNAEIEQDTLKTELEMKRLENQTRIETLRGMQKQADMFTKLGSSFMRALFDPELPQEQRDRLLGSMQSFMTAGKQLPPKQQETTVIEEEGEENL